ncbi:hypothetical protein [Oceanobacillus halophilus]|uniref:Uncharacterized protein n=1 Tax=Oceanobacillus halophilus TaxID=930130 RepID=A0A495A8H2_9BACI|nr:hypothetical protein [Oceanobacillus halophilus]RKQ34735.1 hypothetical protein D8M06_07410 [Oceanobacillus halophilus]
MKHIYAFEKKEDFETYQKRIDQFKKGLNDYQEILKEKYGLKTGPRAVVWTSEKLATEVFSDVPIPAYTNKDIIYMSPDLSEWRTLFLKQLDGIKIPYIEHFYKNYSENQLFTILGHELTHHSDWFLDEFDDDRDNGIWFEEGMCEYLPRKHCLNETEFKEIVKVESELVDIFKGKYGINSIEEFGSTTYKGSLSSIMFDYWRSFLLVKELVEERANGNVELIFKIYHEWDEKGRKVPLTEYFEAEFTK